jgi:two-component system sensor histidine kinase AlgZ
MNTIASLTRSNPIQAERAVEDLADLFRVSLAEKNNLTLKEEVSVTERYLAIETHRLGDRLKVEWAIDEDIDWYIEVPALILQPLVENALYHGIEPLTEGGTVTISVESVPGAIEVSVANPLSQKTDQQRHKGNQIAQENIRQRLLLEFGEEGKLNIEAKDDQYVVSFRIPR